MIRICLPSAFLRLADEHEGENRAAPFASSERRVNPSHSLPRVDDPARPQGGEFPALAVAAPSKDTLPSSRDASPCNGRDLLTAAAVERNDAERNSAGWADRVSLEAGRASLDAQQQGMSRMPPRSPSGSGRVSLEESCCGRSYRCDNMCFRGLEAFPGEPTRRSDASPHPSTPKKPLGRKSSSSIPRVMSDVDQISARYSDPVHIRGESDRYRSQGRTWGSARDTAYSQSASFANLGSLSATGSFLETRDSNHRSASGLGLCTRLQSSHRHSLGASLSELALIEEALGLSQQDSLHADDLRTEDHSDPGHVHGDSLCGGCSWRAAELACSPMWVDSARSRIQEAALAVVEAQQAAVELSARIDEAEGRATGGLAARGLPGLPSPVTKRSFDGVGSLGHRTMEGGIGSPKGASLLAANRTRSEGSYIGRRIAKLFSMTKV